MGKSNEFHAKFYRLNGCVQKEQQNVQRAQVVVGPSVLFQVTAGVAMRNMDEKSV